jgi:branched-chain amino acid transport system substrate-binding protein
MGKWKRIITTLVAGGLALTIVAGLAACGSTSAGSKGTIKICTELPVTQADASAGKPAQNGATLAIKQAQDNHTIAGYDLVQVNYDDVGASGTHDPTVGANNIRDAIGHAEIAACDGPFNSSVAKSEMPVANQAPLGLISPSNTNQTLTKPQYGATAQYRPTGKVTYFRVCTTDDIQGPAMADYYYDQLKNASGGPVRNVYVVNDTETYGAGIAQTFSDEFKKKGGTIIANDGLVFSSTPDYGPEATKIASHTPDAIYFGGNDSTGGIKLVIAVRKTPGLDKTPYGGGDGIQTSDYITGAGASGAGSLSTVAAVNADTLPAAASFKSAFTAMFPNAADYGAYSANSYDAMNIIIQSIKNAIAGGATPPANDNDSAAAKTFRQAVIDQIAKTNYSGVIGTTTFDANGDTSNRWISVYQVGTKSGKSDWDFLYQLQFK